MTEKLCMKFPACFDEHSVLPIEFEEREQFHSLKTTAILSTQTVSNLKCKVFMCIPEVQSE